MAPGFSCTLLQGVFPYVFPLQKIFMRSADFQSVQETVHLVSAFPPHLLRYVGVGVQCKRRGIVTQIFLHGLDVTPGLKRQNRVAMPQVMEPHVWYTHSGEDTFQVAVYQIMFQVPPQFIRKHKVVRVVPARTRSQSHFQLTDFLRL